jgi:hypothetical protein
MPRARRISFGIVTWPLLVTVEDSTVGLSRYYSATTLPSAPPPVPMTPHMRGVGSGGGTAAGRADGLEGAGTAKGV